jgi:hypothetical protein
MSGAEAGDPLKSLFYRALFLRVIVALGIHFLTSEELFAPDQRTYHAVGSWLANYWSGDTFVYPPNLLESTPRAYYHVVGALYYVLGAAPLVPKLVNCLVGALTVPLVHDLALGMTGQRPMALRAATYAAYFPSLVLWSALNIRDAWIILLIVLICRHALALHDELRLRSLVILGGAVFALVQFRSYILFAVTLPMVVSFLARGRQHLARNVILGMLAVVAVIYADRAAGSDRRLRSLDLEELHEIRYWNTVGAGSRFEQADISTPGKALAFLPKGLAYFLLAPFPWMLGTIRQVLALPEMLFFYSLIPAMLRGFRYLLRERLGTSLMVVLLTAGLTFGYALGEGNAGTAYRHRAQVLSFYLVFAAVGVELRRARRAIPEAPARSLPRSA